jgi:glutaredoxin-dependent peroxiredoxin
MATPATRREFLGASLAVAAALAAGCPARSEAVEVGQKAPDFSLPSTTGGKISLSQFRGQPVLIEFYGADFAPVWADNLSARKADFAQLKAIGVQVLGISADHGFSQKAFAESLKLPYPLLSDYSLDVTKAYGVVYGQVPAAPPDQYPEVKGRIAKRAFFLIDREGTIRGRWMGEDLAIFPTEILLKAAREMVGPRR